MKRICTLFTQFTAEVFSNSTISKSRETYSFLRRAILFFAFIAFFAFTSLNTFGQLGVYEFSGPGLCPHQNLSVVSQPANAIFNNVSAVNVTCNATSDQLSFDNWNENGTINLNEYIEFTITALPTYVLNLSSLSFNHSVSENGSGSGMGRTAWFLRSSNDNYSTNIATGSANENIQSPFILLPAGNFSSINAVTFRLYLIEAKDDETYWTIDGLTVNGSTALIPADPADPTSDAPQCSNPGVTLTATGTAPAGETWYWQTSATGTSTANSGSTYTVTSSGTYYIRSQDNTTLLWSNGAGSIVVTVTPDVSVPVFVPGASSSRCDATETITYTANAANSTGITYSLDAASIAGGNSIDVNTGAVSYVAGWIGTSIITASATGCSGPVTSTHTVTTLGNVGSPVFVSGAASTRCQGVGTVTYPANASNATGLNYTLDVASIAGGNTINASTGAVNYAAGWVGNSTITATAAGCSGPTIATHTVTINPSVTLPVFVLGASSTRCQAAETISYIANATNSTGIIYNLDAASIAGGNTINSATGAVTYTAGWSGTSIITASAAGCNGPRTSNHNVTTRGNVTVPIFTLGASSTRCQAGGNVNYAATAVNSTGITYSLDAASIAGGLSINPATGTVTYVGGWVGTTTITATAAGCNGPTTAIHTVTINPTIGVPVFALGGSSVRCLGVSTVTYTATATNTTNITYSIDGTSAFFGVTINPTTGQVTYSLSHTGPTTITATAVGCGGPRTATHTVTIAAAVGVPFFVAGSNSTRCQGAATVTYTANAANTTGITYSLDAASIAGGNTINSATGAVTYAAGWNGTSAITASAAGCNGPRNSTHTVTTNGLVTAPVFVLGTSSTRCQGAGSVTYTSNATNTTGITYSLNAAALAAGNTINALTGAVSYQPLWAGVTIITASATGCSGPQTSTHTVTITPIVGLPVFTLGASSTRCQGAGSITYSASATNSTGITYSIDASSIAGGNSINSITGSLTFAVGWTGTTTVTASAAGCNGPRTSTHTVTVTPTVGVPVFVMGPVSTRIQGAATVSYSASATNSTGITYSLDAASIAGGNTINASTGAVTYAAGWIGTSTITATAAGCNGPRSSTHMVSTNSSAVYKQLYLSDPAQSLDRVDPVNTSDATTASSALLSTTGTTFTTFTMAPALCDSLTIDAGAITIRNFVTLSSGTMPANPAITAQISFGATNIITISNPTYSGGMLTWTANLAAPVTVPAGQAITLRITTAQAAVIFRIDFDSQTKPSRIDIPVTSFIKITSLAVYNAPYPGGIQVSSGLGGTKYIRATVTDPFGSADITALNVTITPTGSSFAATSVATSGCTRTYEYVWNVGAGSATYAISAIAREGFENAVTDTRNTSFAVCTTCAPVAVNDSATGTGGNPLVVPVLTNDYDPNNNMNAASLTIVTQPANGSAYISNNTIIYLPNGTFQGKDTITYQICDLTSPTPLCATARVFYTIDPLIVDICADATKTHTYYIPYPEQQAYTALEASGSPAMPSNNIRTIISIKIPYPGMRITWDEWEDGYEANIMNPVQATTKVWGDGNPFNGIAPGYPSDFIPAGGSIVLDNTMNANPRNPANIYYDGKDKVVSNGQLALTQVSAEPSIMSVQSIKTNITSTYDFGQSFTIPLGQDFPSRDFRYTALFIRASENNTTINIDRNNDGVFETTTVLNEGGSYLVNGGVLTGATVASDKPVGVELSAGGVDNYSIRNAPIFPATWYSHTYYTPVPTSDNAGDNPKDTSVVMFYNSLNRPININWYSGAPASGVINVPAKTAVRFPLRYSTTAAYRFVNLTGESFTAIEIVNSYSPDGTGTSGAAYDWSFNLIAESRLTDYTTVAWAPGGLDLGGSPGPDVNGNPIWVTPTANTTIYVKYDGNVSGTSGLVSPCGLRYDVSYNVNALNYIKIRDNSDNDQGGIAIYTCNGAKIAAVYGEDPTGSTAGNSAYWDVGSTIQPFCKQKLLIATDDYATTLVSQPVTIPVLNNDLGFLAVINPSTVTTVGLMQPQHGTVSVNPDGTILYEPNPGFSGVDSFEYNVCSTPSPVVCDIALVVIQISTCPTNGNQNIISGQVYIDRNKDAINNDGATGLSGVKVYLYTDGNCSGTINPNELTDSVVVDSSGFYQFMKYPEKTTADNFDNGAASSCASGSDGDSPWGNNWSDAGDAAAGVCSGSSTGDAEVLRDGAFGYALRLKDNDISARRSLNLSGATKAFLTFSYRRKSNTFNSSNNIYVQISPNGTAYTTIYTISGNGAVDANYITIYNQDISGYATANTTIRFLTDGGMSNDDSVYIDDVSVIYLKYPQCYIAAVNTSTAQPGYTLTTAGSRPMTITAGGTCTSQFDFGFAKPNITITGTLRNDYNALVDGQVNGAPVGNPGGATVYAYLTNASGDIVLKTTVNSANGTYSFPLAEVHTSYTLMLSTFNLALGASAPATMGCPASWINVGDSYGINNLAGAGNLPGIPNASIPITTGATNVSNVDIGIQRLPNSDDKLSAILTPSINDLVTLNGQGANPPVLSGSDPEDCTAGCNLNNRTVIIDTVPNTSELYYNGMLVVNGQVINNFNPSLLQVKFTAISVGQTYTSFRYSFVDAAIMKDPTPATYTLLWVLPLPVTGLTAQAILNDDIATVKWSTISEQNTSHFIIERSTDNVNFNAVGNQVKAAGNSETKREYQLPDNVSGLSQYSVIYYRVKLVDLDGKIAYSNIVPVRLSQRPNFQIATWPNPFQTTINLNVTTDTETTLSIRMMEATGKLIRTLTRQVPKGVSQIVLKEFDQLVPGLYLLEITDQRTKTTTIQKLIRSNK